VSDRKPVWRRLYEGWMEVAVRFGEVQTIIVVFLVYAVVVGPMATAAGVARKDLLDKRALHDPGSAWREADSVKKPDLERARRLF
jgi:hypothetical protein